MSILTYEEKASEIIKNSIKSAIFIDEKAVDFYTKIPNEEVLEERLSKNLFENFRNNGVSLTVNKYDFSKRLDQTYLSYLLDQRDLILLDWKLEGETGEKYSLELLSKVIESKAIHFCSIYTSETNTDSIFSNIMSFFSGKSADYYSEIKELIEIYQDGTIAIDCLDKISYDSKLNGRLFPEFKAINESLPQDIIDVTQISDFSLALVQVKIALSGGHISELPLSIPSYLNQKNNTLTIGSTIISIISKKEDDYDKIVQVLKEQILATPNHFMELLGLDMQFLFDTNSSFINPNILNVDFNTMLNHRKQIIESGSELEFESFISDLLVEQAKMNIENSHLSILESSFLNKQLETIEEITEENICRLNCFYNGSVQKKTHINFGDIFVDQGKNEYYLCITPLCDCLHPENIKNKFYFIKGQKVNDVTEIISSGDSWFKSYLNNGITILWAKDVDYIKPIQLDVKENTFSNNKIIVNLVEDDKLVQASFEYLFSLKNSYAQRITNHAFNHPVRVGVDFVKLKS